MSKCANDELVLHYFRASEFGKTDHRDRDWWPAMNPGLLVRLDVLRSMWGGPIHVSGHARALGRHGGDSHSDHNVDRWGDVRGADVFISDVRYRADVEAVKMAAEEVGFSSIGVYPDWRGGIGFHLGVREDNGGRQPMATWGAVSREGSQEYVSFKEALSKVPVVDRG